MGYESLSTVVVLVIVAIIIVVWLPVRTANGMKRVDEHRQDRYSPSLHIVDAENGRRFGDIKPHKAKGAAMPASTPSARLTPEHIAHVRELRRAAIRRRQILAVCLLAITVLVFAVSFPLHFSPLLALIPFVLLLLVLVLGANASRQARQWERKVVRYERAHSGTGWSKKPSAESKDSKRVNKAEPVAAVTAPAEKPAEQIEDAATEVMEQRQIRRALRDAEIEQAKAKAEEILGKLNAGEDFDTLMKENSMDNETSFEGYSFTHNDGQFDQDFDNAAYALEVGQTSDVVKTRFGYHIIKRLPLQEEFPALDTVRDNVIAMIKSERYQTMVAEEWVPAATIVKQEEVFNSIK